MRLKHVKGALETIENSIYVIKEPKLLKGKYQSLFQNNNPIYLEIGIGKGDFIIENAIKNKNINYIGIEKFDSVIVRAIEKLEEKKLDNIKLIRMDATEIEEIFENEISLLYLNFSDPWPKKRHAHRRLTSPIFLKKYQSLFIDKIQIEMKTDSRHLFEYSITSFNNESFKIEDICLDLYSENIEDNIQTEYEKKFVSKGNIIYKIKVFK